MWKDRAHKNWSMVIPQNASFKKPHEFYPFTVPCGPRRKKNYPWSDIRFSLRNLPVHAFDSRAQGIQLSPCLSTIELPSAFAESGAYPPDRALSGSPRQCSLPLACRHPPEELGRGAHLGTPSSANHTAASQLTGRIAKAASWLRLSRLG